MELFVFAYGERSDIVYGTYNFQSAKKKLLYAVYFTLRLKITYFLTSEKSNIEWTFFLFLQAFV